MSIEDQLRERWGWLRERLTAKSLLNNEAASLSLRIPGSQAMWFGLATDPAPQRLHFSKALKLARQHAAIYALRGDVGAVAAGGGAFGNCLADHGGALPQVFDEQARHLGPMGKASDSVETATTVMHGHGNVLMVQRRPICLGMTAMRLALNAELFEKCAKAYVLAVAGGGRVRPLPWIVRLVANQRLSKDERRAAERWRLGELPEEAKGY
ncbi:MAG TPA: hypothetical protein VIN35_09050 [Hydrogenophaga sp.]